MKVQQMKNGDNVYDVKLNKCCHGVMRSTALTTHMKPMTLVKQ